MEQAAFLALIFGVWRLTDGGFHRHRFSSAVGWALILAACLGLVENIYVAALFALAMGRQITQGYEEWNDYRAQALRAWPSATVPLVAAAASGFGWYAVDYMTVWMVPALCLASNVAQPWLRARMSNRPVEFLEGAALGAAISVL